jgi:SAM-dependent methyltransferase
MRKLYERQWMGIEFRTFARTSPHRLADAAFYEDFYQTFFQHHRSWEDLDPEWRWRKQAMAQFIFERIEGREAVLSLGCGLGWMEHCLLKLSGGCLQLEVTEVAVAALGWIREELAPAKVHMGLFPQCLPAGRRFDLIYLSAVDYCLEPPDLIGLLSQASRCLNPGGRCLLFSASFERPLPLRARLSVALGWMAAAAGLSDLQFWGWERNREDYRGAFARAGYQEISDGFGAGDQGAKSYWIEGRVPRGGQAR